MGTLIAFMGAGVVAVMQLAFAAPGDSTPDEPRRPALLRSSHSVMREYVPVTDSAFAGAVLPRNLVAAEEYGPILERMRERSAAFRRQCARVAGAPYLTVVLIPAAAPVQLQAAAWTTITRGPRGELKALIRVPPTSRAPELIAHELEHVIEQLDGIDLPGKARLRSAGVHLVDGGAPETYETERATKIGLLVAREFRGDR
jgi:hypothetical protein